MKQHLSKFRNIYLPETRFRIGEQCKKIYEALNSYSIDDYTIAFLVLFVLVWIGGFITVLSA